MRKDLPEMKLDWPPAERADYLEWCLEWDLSRDLSREESFEEESLSLCRELSLTVVW